MRKKGIKSPTKLITQLINYNIPPFEDYNVCEDYAIVIDKRAGKGIWVHVYIKENKPYCDFCKSHDCEHIKFLLEKEDFVEMLKKK